MWGSLTLEKRGNYGPRGVDRRLGWLRGWCEREGGMRCVRGGGLDVYYYAALDVVVAVSTYNCHSGDIL